MYMVLILVALSSVWVTFLAFRHAKKPSASAVYMDGMRQRRKMKHQQSEVNADAIEGDEFPTSASSRLKT